MDSAGRRIVVCDNGTGVSLKIAVFMYLVNSN